MNISVFFYLIKSILCIIVKRYNNISLINSGAFIPISADAVSIRLCLGYRLFGIYVVYNNC